MFKKVLIANRGEIAVRVISACKDLGIRTVAVYSEADRESLHVRHADEALCIGPPRSKDSYLNVPAVISAAEITDVDAIHPGYGFLAENAGFADVCRESGIRFIGPEVKPFGRWATKPKLASRRARRVCRSCRVRGAARNRTRGSFPSEGHRLPGHPQGGRRRRGRGMRIVREPSELPELFHQARHEAAVSFQSSDVYLEKYIEGPRHIEFQILGDNHGNVAALGERECSIQRRHQKLIEEAPSPRIDSKTRNRMCRRLEKAFERVGYSNAGTAEFLMDDEGKLYFIELNARIQVEHPITEAVTGIDLVKSQLLLAAGEPLSSIVSGKIEPRGHAIECRINAENPKTFVPSAGRITQMLLPGGPGIRVDTAAYSGWFVPPYYDSLVAKLIAHGRDRTEAISRMQRSPLA